MSVPKYKLLFKKIIKTNSNRFFIDEKLLVGNEFLTSGSFNSVAVAYQLGYTLIGYFSAMYKKKNQLSPADILIKKYKFQLG